MSASGECLIIGGGIAGVSCAETLSILQPSLRTVLISASSLVKVATGVRQLTKTLDEFDVEERPFDWVESRNANLSVVWGEVASLNPEEHVVVLRDGRRFTYKLLCICSGGKPKLIANDHPSVIGIRDTESVKEFISKLGDARRVMIVGNGGIATEMASELKDVELIWVVKDDSVSATFVDAGAAQFFLSSRRTRKENNSDHSNTNDDKPKVSKRLKYTEVHPCRSMTTHGSALGPDWAADILMKGKSNGKYDLNIQYSCEVQALMTHEEYLSSGDKSADEDGTKEVRWPVYAKLTNGKTFGCDFVVSATGVTPNLDFARSVLPVDGIAVDGGMKVDERMETCLRDVFAAGDVCTTMWEPAPHWMQMRLWSQARQMGSYAAKCMVAKWNNEEITLDFGFEMFSHATRFFGFKVILLGLFNGQRLGKEYEILLRMNKGEEYIKAIVKDGRLQGAILIGETDLEETFENLILNRIDISRFGEDLLNPDVDIEDYFD
ncbi:hypothetical protein RvY_15363 [Ramazzottius varieornatus]|uniref:Pyridine nucleotide-disulfide oxidoreductase domain-containing protein 1 n=1 Tax=Ramazzottius varieornatus TaxID=947166 RepID=A0A1D1VUM6_RAMVA|nr:hypothetical protein RvY_15363 [Ramazzottius varieornatus]